jgi:hypothetical protein
VEIISFHACLHDGDESAQALERLSALGIHEAGAPPTSACSRQPDPETKVGPASR